MEFPQFHTIVEDVWQQKLIGDNMKQIWSKLKMLKNRLKETNRYMATYEQRIIQAREQLDIIQSQMQINPQQQELINEERKALADIEKWSNIEEQVMRQKSRATWIECGDANTKYFHAQWKIRNSQNTISSVYSEAGDHITDPAAVELEFISVFQDLLGGSAEELTSVDIAIVKEGKCLSLEQQRRLIKEVTMEEVTEAMHDMPRDKAPGVDGYPVEFFTKNWELIKDDILAATKDFFRTNSMPSYINTTAIALVPKTNSPATVKDYRPIACCTTLYKLISKIITRRLKEVVTDIVGMAQSAFIEGRSIVDNILLSHEIFKGYARKGVSPRCVLKMDLRKAYDSLEWSFLKQLLVAYGFPAKFIEWIMACTTTVSFSLIMNGGLTKPFKAKRGIRQGDPMSPYLFVMAMEYLSRILGQLSRNGNFNFHPKCRKLNCTHVCFADDLLLFCRADSISIQLLHQAFLQFSKASGLEANPNKSSIYLAGVNQDFKADIISRLGVSEGMLPFRYLGIPLDSKKLDIQHYLPLIEKITARVRCWSAKLLSYAGRSQLIKAVIFGIQSYWSQLFILPKKVLKAIDVICRTFLWTGSTSYSRRALVAWDKVCTPLNAGGLNIMNLSIWNKAAVSKLLWDLTRKKDCLWVKWIHSYYIKKGEVETTNVPKQAAWVIRKILQCRESIMGNMKMVGNLYDRLGAVCSMGKYQIHKCYIAMLPCYERVSWRNLMLVQNVIPRHKFTAWLAAHQRLPTVDRLAKVGIQLPSLYIFCKQYEETFHHLYFECCITRQLWYRVCCWLGCQRQILTWEEELTLICKGARSAAWRKSVLATAFVNVVAIIWKSRNNMRFQNLAFDEGRAAREVAILIHTRGRQCKRWSKGLQLLNSFP